MTLALLPGGGPPEAPHMGATRPPYPRAPIIGLCGCVAGFKLVRVLLDYFE